MVGVYTAVLQTQDIVACLPAFPPCWIFAFLPSCLPAFLPSRRHACLLASPRHGLAACVLQITVSGLFDANRAAQHKNRCTHQNTADLPAGAHSGGPEAAVRLRPEPRARPARAPDPRQHAAGGVRTGFQGEDGQGSGLV